MASADPGILFVLSAPSGTGKSTVARRLLERVPELEFSVSHTTRPIRAGEQDGRDYHFVDRGRFERMVEEGAFLEWAAVFQHLYGTGSDVTRASLAAGKELLLDGDSFWGRLVFRRARFLLKVKSCLDLLFGGQAEVFQNIAQALPATGLLDQLAR